MLRLQQRQALLSLCFFCCCSLIFSVEAFRSGDLVRTKKQSFFGGVPTAWTEVVAHDSPRFLQPRSLRLPSLDSQEDRSTSYKVAFSFADDRFITPLITISDGKDVLAGSVTFTFIYSGNTIIDLRWTAEHRQGIMEKQEHFFIYYEWERYSELDSEAGMAFLFLSGFTLGAAMFAYVLISSGLETRPSTQLPTRVVQRGSVQPTSSTVSDNNIPTRHRSYAREPTSPAVVLSPEPFASSETTGPVLAISPVQEEPFPPFTEFVGSSSLGSTTLPPTLQDHHSQEHSRKSD